MEVNYGDNKRQKAASNVRYDRRIDYDLKRVHVNACDVVEGRNNGFVEKQN